MRIAVHHTTTYRFDRPASHGLQRLRLRPRDGAGQKVLDWSLDIAGGRIEEEYVDHNQNAVTLISFGHSSAGGGSAGGGLAGGLDQLGDAAGAHEVSITTRGLVETHDRAGVVGPHTGFAPLWLYTNQTDLTRPGPVMKALAARFGPVGSVCQNALEVLHALSEAVRDGVDYATGSTLATTTAEAAAAAGRGVCQDHAHVFIGAARALGVPARYVSGYLLMDAGVAQQASHAWAEAHVEGLGWVGFDVSNRMCPDARYVRLAVGTDYRDAAPVTSLTQGGGACDLAVSLEVACQVAQ